MAKVIPGRFTAQTDQPFVVFLIGMRINKLRALRKWLPTFLAMPRMLKDLYTHPEKGLPRRASLPFGPHDPHRAILALVRRPRTLRPRRQRPAHARLAPLQQGRRHKDGSVGIFHESYLVQPGQFETVYANMPALRPRRRHQAGPRAGRPLHRAPPPRWRERTRRPHRRLCRLSFSQLPNWMRLRQAVRQTVEGCDMSRQSSPTKSRSAATHPQRESDRYDGHQRHSHH